MVVAIRSVETYGLANGRPAGRRTGPGIPKGVSVDGEAVIAREVLKLRREVSQLKSLIFALAGAFGCAADWFRGTDEPEVIDQLAELQMEAS